jgi:hypothetical protein
MQLSRKGLAQVTGERFMHLCTLAPTSPVSQLGVLLLQASARVLRSKAANEASFASIAGLDKVRIACMQPVPPRCKGMSYA